MVKICDNSQFAFATKPLKIILLVIAAKRCQYVHLLYFYVPIDQLETEISA